MSSKPTSGTVTLEVSPRSAKVLVAAPGPFQIQRLNASTLPDQTEDPVAALRALLDAQPLGVREVGVLIGREAFSLRTLELPSSEPNEIASMLDLQLGKLTPYSRADILSAWSVIGSFREGYTSVLVAIAPKTLIENVLNFLKTKGVTPRWVGLATEGLEAWRACDPSGAPPADGQLTAIINLDFASTDCAILSADGRLLFTHSIAIGAEQFTASEQAQLRWVGELVRLPRILVHEEVKGRIGAGILTGVIDNLGHVVEQLATQWGIPVEVKDALEPVALSSIRERARATRVSYTSLIGILAAGKPPRIDLIPQEARVSQALQVRSRQLARLAISLGVILALVAVLCGEWVLVLRHHLSELERRLAPIEQTSHDVMARQATMRKVRAWLNPARSPLEVFRSVSAAVDADIVINQLIMETGKPVVIRGKSNSMAQAFAFADHLKQQGTFATINVRPVLKPRGGNESGVEFEMSCELAGS